LSYNQSKIPKTALLLSSLVNWGRSPFGLNMECSQMVLQHHQHIHQALFHLAHHKCFRGVLPERVQGFQLLHPLPPLRKVLLLQNQHRSLLDCQVVAPRRALLRRDHRRDHQQQHLLERQLQIDPPSAEQSQCNVIQVMTGFGSGFGRCRYHVPDLVKWKVYRGLGDVLPCHCQT
jgi:hypothetical protein